MRWVVGDLQGCVRGLERLLRDKACRFDPARDELWCCGDLINRGPDSLETLRLWREMGGKGVLGNHEVYALSAFAGHWPRKKDTLQALFDAPDAEELLAALRALPLLAKLPAKQSKGRPKAPLGEAWLVHGGVHPQWHDLNAAAARINAGPHDQAWLESPDTKFATRVRCCNAQGDMARHHGKPQDCPEGYTSWDELRAPGPWIIHGHWAWRGHHRNEQAKVMGLDSGGVYGGPITAWCMDEDRVVQVASG